MWHGAVGRQTRVLYHSDHLTVCICEVDLVLQQSKCLIKMACRHVGLLGAAVMRVALQGAGPTEAGEIPLAEGSSTAGEAGAEAGVTATEAVVISAVAANMAGVQGEAISAASKRKLTLSLSTDLSVMRPNSGILGARTRLASACACSMF